MTDPRSTDLSAEEQDLIDRGHWLFAQPCTFIKGVVALDQLPGDDRPEITFAGRSNVGKSSLINALTNRKTLARTSNTPGRTREINFFELTKALYLVDLPGYGYAKVERRLVERWVALLKDYLKGRANLRRVSILVDIRHGLKPSDVEMMDMLDVAAVSYQVVLTKADKVKLAERERMETKIQGQLAKRTAAFPRVFVTSSEKGWGIDELRAELASLANWQAIEYKKA